MEVSSDILGGAAFVSVGRKAETVSSLVWAHCPPFFTLPKLFGNLVTQRLAQSGKERTSCKVFAVPYDGMNFESISEQDTCVGSPYNSQDHVSENGM
jgi:hypothetical protein